MPGRPRPLEQVIEDVLGRLPSHLGPDVCWPWPGARSTSRTGEPGYGHFRAGIIRRGATFYVHRLVFIVFWGAIPPGHEVCHTCDHPPCCNPLHLFTAPHRINLADAASKGRCNGQT